MALSGPEWPIVSKSGVPKCLRVASELPRVDQSGPEWTREDLKWPKVAQSGQERTRVDPKSLSDSLHCKEIIIFQTTQTHLKIL